MAPEVTCKSNGQLSIFLEAEYTSCPCPTVHRTPERPEPPTEFTPAANSVGTGAAAGCEPAESSFLPPNSLEFTLARFTVTDPVPGDVD